MSMDYGPLLILPSLKSEGMVSCIFPPELESQRFEPSKYQWLSVNRIRDSWISVERSILGLFSHAERFFWLQTVLGPEIEWKIMGGA